MQITARSEYAVRAVLDLAIHYGDAYVLAREIAERQHIPPKFLPQILHRLRSADLLEASRGAKGGFRLKVHPSKLNVTTVVQAIQGPISVYPCGADSDCVLHQDCPICGLWTDTRNSMLKVLSGAYFSQLAAAKIGAIEILAVDNSACHDVSVRQDGITNP